MKIYQHGPIDNEWYYLEVVIYIPLIFLYYFVVILIYFNLYVIHWGVKITLKSFLMMIKRYQNDGFDEVMKIFQTFIIKTFLMVDLLFEQDMFNALLEKIVILVYMISGTVIDEYSEDGSSEIDSILSF